MFQAFSFPFQPKNETVSHSVTASKAGKALDLSAPRLEAIAWAAMYLKCFPLPNATHSSSTFIYSTTEIASTTTSVSAVRIIIFFCSMKKYSCVGLFVPTKRPTHECPHTSIHSYGSGLFLWLMRLRCHRKWRPVFCEKLEYFQFLWKESKTGHSCSHRSSRSSSRWKLMVSKVTPYDVDLGPVCFLSWPLSCL